jgi:Icc-related predicted phosphoesterase
MKALVLSDRPPSRKISDSVRDARPDLIITLGDFDQSEIAELESIDAVPKIGVYGNHDSGVYMEPLGIQNMHLQTFEHKGLLFGGFEGCVRYKESKYARMYTQEEAREMLKSFPRVDVMIAHCPPYGVNDDPEDASHIGYQGLREYLDRKHPGWLLHGHTYPSANSLMTQYAQTRIVYVYGDAIVELEN